VHPIPCAREAPAPCEEIRRLIGRSRSRRIHLCRSTCTYVRGGSRSTSSCEREEHTKCARGKEKEWNREKQRLLCARLTNLPLPSPWPTHRLRARAATTYRPRCPGLRERLSIPFLNQATGESRWSEGPAADADVFFPPGGRPGSPAAAWLHRRDRRSSNASPRARVAIQAER